MEGTDRKERDVVFDELCDLGIRIQDVQTQSKPTGVIDERYCQKEAEWKHS